MQGATAALDTETKPARVTFSFAMPKQTWRGTMCFLFVSTNKKAAEWYHLAPSCELLHRSVTSVTHFHVPTVRRMRVIFKKISVGLKKFLFYWCTVLFSLFLLCSFNFYMKLSLKLVSTIITCMSCILITIVCVRVCVCARVRAGVCFMCTVPPTTWLWN